MKQTFPCMNIIYYNIFLYMYVLFVCFEIKYFKAGGMYTPLCDYPRFTPPSTCFVSVFSVVFKSVQIRTPLEHVHCGTNSVLIK